MSKTKATRKTDLSKKDSRSQSMSHATPAPFSYEELREISIQISASQFRAPETTRLTLMEVHPWRLHAYWNIAEADLADARASLPADADLDLPLILRFTDLSAQQGEPTPDQHFDIEVEGLRNNWYVDLWQDGRRYSAQLGLRTTDGKMIPLARSKEVELPRATPSSELVFKQLEVRTPLPLDFDIPETGSDHGEHLLQNLFPKRLPLDEEFPELTPEVPDIEFDEPECPASKSVADALEYRPVPLRPEQPLTDHSHTAQLSPPEVPALPEVREFPLVDNSEIAPYSIQAKQEKARLLDEIEMELPHAAEELISPTNVELTPQPLPFLNSEPELRHSTLPSKATLEPSSHIGAPDLSVAQAPGDKPEFMQRGFPEVMPNRDADFAAHERPVPVELQSEVPMAANTPHAHSMMTQEAAPEQFGTASGPAPRPVIALEDELGNALFSYGRGESGLEANAELHLHGKLNSDHVLSLFGEQVDVDAQGNFSVRLKLDRGPALAALLYGQRNRTEGHN